MGTQHMFSWRNKKKYLGPVVQSVVSLTSLRVISLTVLAVSIYNIMIFLLKKCEKLLTFFQQKISVYSRITGNFNELLTNDIVSFEQLGPVFFCCVEKKKKKKAPYLELRHIWYLP